MNYKQIYEAVLEHYGRRNQADKAVEELGELIVALQHFAHGRATMEEVRSEIADVCIMSYQLALMFGLTEVEAEIRHKTQRLLDRIDNETTDYTFDYGTGIGKE